MSVLTQLLSRHHPRTGEKTRLQEAATAKSKPGENVWCATTFLMFMVMGPFAAIPALFSVLSLIPGDEKNEPETIDA
jgi:hypothetical protein